MTRTQSAPLRSSQLSLSMQNAGPEQVTDVEINARLDSLCLSMTEHAIGSLGMVVYGFFKFNVVF